MLISAVSKTRVWYAGCWVLGPNFILCAASTFLEVPCHCQTRISSWIWYSYLTWTQIFHQVEGTVQKRWLMADLMWDVLCSQLQCCGWTNYTDWDNYENWNKTNTGYVPASCCNVDAANMRNESCPNRINMKKHSSIIYSKVMHVLVFCVLYCTLLPTMYRIA